MNKHKAISENSFIGLWRFLYGYRFRYLVAVLCRAVAVLAGTAGYFLLKYYIDDVIVKKMWHVPLYFFAAAFVGFYIIRGIFSFFSGRACAGAAEGVTKGIRNTLFDHLQKLSFRYHDRNETGELIQRSTSDVDTVRSFYSEIVIELIGIFFRFIINFTAIILLHVQLALFSIIVVPIIILVSRYFFNLIFKSYGRYQEQDGKVSAKIQENLTGIRIVRAFARQEFEKDKFEDVNKEKLRLGKKFVISHALYWPASHFICTAQTTAGAVLAAFMVINDQLSIGTFIAYIGMVNAIIWPLQQMGRLLAQLSTTSVSYKRIADIIKEEKEELTRGLDLKNKVILEGDIVFKNVSFAYDKNAPVLKDVSFTCKSGDVIALAGETGSGKTSLINLLPRFYEYTKGEIYIDEISLKDFSRHYLRRKIGIVEQEPFLFSMTIKDNIMYGIDRKVGDGEIIDVAKSAAIHDSIMSFPDGYETLVGERGVSLSGGQRQRIAIARTLLKDPRILILDDSTSAVDLETEQYIRQALNVLMKGRTTFVVAHRVQSLMNADLILVFKQGRVIQAGPHHELIKSDGYYSELFKLQTSLIYT